MSVPPRCSAARAAPPPRPGRAPGRRRRSRRPAAHARRRPAPSARARSRSPSTRLTKQPPPRTMWSIACARAAAIAASRQAVGQREVERRRAACHGLGVGRDRRRTGPATTGRRSRPCTADACEIGLRAQRRRGAACSSAIAASASRGLTQAQAERRRRRRRTSGRRCCVGGQFRPRVEHRAHAARPAAAPTAGAKRGSISSPRPSACSTAAASAPGLARRQRRRRAARADAGARAGASDAQPRRLDPAAARRPRRCRRCPGRSRRARGRSRARAGPARPCTAATWAWWCCTAHRGHAEFARPAPAPAGVLWKSGCRSCATASTWPPARRSSASSDASQRRVQASRVAQIAVQRRPVQLPCRRAGRRVFFR